MCGYWVLQSYLFSSCMLVNILCAAIRASLARRQNPKTCANCHAKRGTGLDVESIWNIFDLELLLPLLLRLPLPTTGLRRRFNNALATCSLPLNLLSDNTTLRLLLSLSFALLTFRLIRRTISER